ncbi:hypothetical protein KC660_00610, partial [Candidatus Dojkabacteria bacterium]|nr:hypothetical protein [Candidatus Dojkabacteria bacterium]
MEGDWRNTYSPSLDTDTSLRILIATNRATLPSISNNLVECSTPGGIINPGISVLFPFLFS